MFTTIFFWIILWSTTFNAQAQEIVCRINLHQTATVDGQMVRLKDVAEIWAQNRELKDKLEQIDIVRSPLAGQIRWVKKDHVIRRLKELGLVPQQWQISANGATRVMQRLVALSAEKIRKAVELHILNNAPWNPDQLKISAIKFKRELQVPTGKVAISVRTPKHSDWLGAVLFNVDVQVSKRLIHKVTVQANIEVWSDVVVAARPLGKFVPIDRQGIKVVRMNLARAPANAIIDTEEIIGKRAKRNIAVNSILRRDQIEMPPLVKRGDRVQAIASSPALQITVQVVVKENGGKGETIRVLNLRSKKIIYAKVVDAKTVSVQF